MHKPEAKKCFFFISNIVFVYLCFVECLSGYYPSRQLQWRFWLENESHSTLSSSDPNYALESVKILIRFQKHKFVEELETF